MKTVYKKQYHVLDDEFIKVPHDEYNNLIILKDLGAKERIISLINEIQSIFNINN
jgi:hypothetical protein